MVRLGGRFVHFSAYKLSVRRNLMVLCGHLFAYPLDIHFPFNSGAARGVEKSNTKFNLMLGGSVSRGRIESPAIAGAAGAAVGGGGGSGWWSDDMSLNGLRSMESEFVRRYHKHETRENQCSSALFKHIKAPIHLVWSLVRRFDQPQKYKPFVSRCVVQGDMEIGSVREVNVKSGLPATTSTERLELLDDDQHVFSIRIVGGDHRLKNYSSVVTLHPESIEGRPGTLVIESFVVDIPEGNTEDETCFFVEALIKCNLKSLAEVSERLRGQDPSEVIGF